MAGHSTHGISVIVVHFAAKNLFSPRAVFSRRDHSFHRLKTVGSELCQIDKAGGAESQRSKNSFLTKPVEAVAGKHLDRFAQDHKTKVAVDVLDARRAQWLFTVD